MPTGTKTRSLTALSAALLALVLLACGGSSAEISTASLSSSTATVVAASTATVTAPSPSATSAPTTTPTVPAPVVTPEASEEEALLSSDVGEDVARIGQAAWERLVDLTETHSPRASGTDQEAAAAEYLLEAFETLGYDGSLQPFEYQTTDTTASATEADSPVPIDFRAFPLRLAAKGTVTGPLVTAGGAFEEDIPAEGLDGKIALVRRGTITFQEKVSRVAAAGALAAVIYNNEPGPFGGTLESESLIPAVSISGADGGDLIELLAAGEVDFKVSIQETTNRSQNVVVEMPGASSSVVVIGGHYDTVPDVPGANDNGSGVATVLALTQELAGRSYPFTLRFILFGAEEEGLFGSRHYVDSLTAAEVDDIVAMLNFDALGTGPVTGILGTFSLADPALELADASGIELVRRFTLGNSSSDHATFDAAGVPNLFFLADDFARIHTPEDKLEFVQPERMGESAVLAIGLLDLLSGSDG